MIKATQKNAICVILIARTFKDNSQSFFIFYFVEDKEKREIPDSNQEKTQQLIDTLVKLKTTTTFDDLPEFGLQKSGIISVPGLSSMTVGSAGRGGRRFFDRAKTEELLKKIFAKAVEMEGEDTEIEIFLNADLAAL